MAIKLKDGLAYEIINLQHDDYIGVINHVDYDIARKNANFSVEIYANVEAYENDLRTISRENFYYEGDDFDEEVGDNGLTIEQAYNLALKKMINWELIV